MRESERLKKLEERFGTGRAPIDPETSQIACDRGTATLDDYAIVYPKQIQQAKGILTLFVPKAADWLRSGGSGLSPTWVDAVGYPPDAELDSPCSLGWFALESFLSKPLNRSEVEWWHHCAPVLRSSDAGWPITRAEYAVWRLAAGPKAIDIRREAWVARDGVWVPSDAAEQARLDLNDADPNFCREHLCGYDEIERVSSRKGALTWSDRVKSAHR